MHEYQPISCALYSQLELLAMHKTPVCIFLKDSELPLKGVIADFRIYDGAEHLVLADASEVRLDRIASVAEQANV